MLNGAKLTLLTVVNGFSRHHGDQHNHEEATTRTLVEARGELLGEQVEELEELNPWRKTSKLACPPFFGASSDKPAPEMLSTFFLEV